MTVFTVEVDESEEKWQRKREKFRRATIEDVEAWISHFRKQTSLNPERAASYARYIRCWCLLIETGEADR